MGRGIDHLGAVGLTNAVAESRAQRKIVRSALLPNIRGYLSETVQQINLGATGFSFDQRIGQLIPPLNTFVVGPFNFFDLRATLNQKVMDVTAWKNGSAKEIVRANEETAEDAEDLVALAVGGAYLQAIAAKARLDASRAQLETAGARSRRLNSAAPASSRRPTLIAPRFRRSPSDSESSRSRTIWRNRKSTWRG